MKKLIVKADFIVQEYEAPIPAIEAVEAQPEKWVKGDIVLYEQPLLEDQTNDHSYTYFPAVEAVEAVEGKPGKPEIKETRIIAQTQGTDDQLAEWLAGDSFKYPEGYIVEYIDISAQVEQEKINAEALAYLASTDWMIVREVETQVPCPAEIKQLRAEARLKVVR